MTAPHNRPVKTVAPALNSFAERHAMSREALAMGLEPKHAAYFYNLGIKAFDDGKIDDAQSAAVIATQCDSTLSEAWVLRGLCHARVFEHEQASACFQKATELDPRNISSFSNLGETLLSLRRFAKAEIALKHAVGLGTHA